MYSAPQLTAKYIRYYLTASSGKGHGIHSPFVYDFVIKVLGNKRRFDSYIGIETGRRRLLKDNRLLPVADYGAGSVTGYRQYRSVASITRNAVKSRKTGQLLFRIANYYKPVSMIELGTSMGLSSAYLALGNPLGRLVSLEGAPAIAALAKENFVSWGIRNISITEGNFDHTLEPLLQTLHGIDLAFIDGNHRQIPTLRYFQQLLQKCKRPAILIFDDIHWSRDMESAWQLIKDHPAVLLTIDLFFMGLVFLNDDFKVKQHFVIRF
ncbi:MAG: class I SAM-dependent methyltransferase [Bacteroidota bacterium]